VELLAVVSCNHNVFLILVVVSALPLAIAITPNVSTYPKAETEIPAILEDTQVVSLHPPTLLESLAICMTFKYNLLRQILALKLHSLLPNPQTANVRLSKNARARFPTKLK